MIDPDNSSPIGSAVADGGIIEVETTKTDYTVCCSISQTTFQISICSLSQADDDIFNLVNLGGFQKYKVG